MPLHSVIPLNVNINITNQAKADTESLEQTSQFTKESTNATASNNAKKGVISCSSKGKSAISGGNWRGSPLQHATPFDKRSPDAKADKLKQFKLHLKENAQREANLNLKDIHTCLQQKELLESSFRCNPAVSPLDGHEVTKEYRTKMMDWMVEVCTSFKCSIRTYFLATQMFDKFIMAQNKVLGKTLNNKDVHTIGVASMYLASKYEDIYPLHSKIVSEKIAHKAISSKEILKKEEDFLKLFKFDVDFVTHYDFW